MVMVQPPAADPIKDFYRTYHDKIGDKRVNSRYPIRWRTHRDVYESVLAHIGPGQRVLDSGCGEGHLSVLMAAKGASVWGIDYSRPNIDAAHQNASVSASSLGEEPPCFSVGDAENLPVSDNVFDAVVSNHVLEHLPHFELGLAELYRVTKDRAIIALPTCLNPCSWALLGGDSYWRISKKTPFAIFRGLARVLYALITGADGVNEGYAGDLSIVHTHFFPNRARSKIEKVGFVIEAIEAQSLCFPYIWGKIPGNRAFPFLRKMGIGTIFVCRKKA